MNVNLKMKYKILTFIFFLLIIQNSFSQKFDLGIKSGSNFATQNIKSISGTKSITGLHVGVFTYIKLPLIFGIQPELQYSTQGTKINSTTMRSIDYLNVPILVRSSFGPMNIHFGPQFGILTGAINEVSGIPTDIKSRARVTVPCNGYPWQQFLATGKRGGKNSSSSSSITFIINSN